MKNEEDEQNQKVYYPCTKCFSAVLSSVCPYCKSELEGPMLSEQAVGIARKALWGRVLRIVFNYLAFISRRKKIQCYQAKQ